MHLYCTPAVWLDQRTALVSSLRESGCCWKVYVSVFECSTPEWKWMSFLWANMVVMEMNVHTLPNNGLHGSMCVSGRISNQAELLSLGSFVASTATKLRSVIQFMCSQTRFWLQTAWCGDDNPVLLLSFLFVGQERVSGILMPHIVKCVVFFKSMVFGCKMDCSPFAVCCVICLKGSGTRQ